MFSSSKPPKPPSPWSAPLASPQGSSTSTSPPPTHCGDTPIITLELRAPSGRSARQGRRQGPRIGNGDGVDAVGAVAGALGGLALEEGAKYEEEKIAERVESSLAARDDYSDYRADY
ncbi:uncharacterized protein A4U43_C07F300 [Asparagus officinalis]|uniref:Uncharacterized protein n=1 Tax=Asparagus officinalis TaxID=4686 RepID=A0A5P1E8F0_ASPOF|nr:uncharacterized protein A4U43_C07F300 [Asparagus officinalis]